MSLFFSELRKLLGNAKLLLIIAVAVTVNVVFLIIPEYTEYSPSSYNALWNRLDELPPSECKGFLAERIAEYDDPRWFTGGTETEFADSFYAEQELLQYVLNEVTQADNYADYLISADQAAENMKSLSFFSDEQSFNYRNIIKTQSDFSKLSADNVRHGRSKGILLAIRFGITDILLFLLSVIFGVKLLSSEREGGFLPLLRSTANGKCRLAAAKFSSLTTSTIFAAALLYGSSIATGRTLYGFGDLSRAFSSVYGYFSCGLRISAAEFFVLFLLVKLLFCIAVSAAVFVFMSMPFGSAVGFAALGGFAAIEIILYLLVPSTSALSALRQINIIAAADAAELLGKYLNVNTFSFPINCIPITILSTVIYTAVCVALGLIGFTLSGEKRRSIKNGLFLGNQTGIVLHELYKSFICGKGIWILLASAITLVVLQKPLKPRYGDIVEYYYYSYISELLGEFTEEKSEYISAQLEVALADTSDEGKYKTEALEKLLAHADYLKECGGYFVADKGYEMLTGCGEVRVYDRLMTAVKAMTLILIVCFSYCAEHRFGGDMLLRSSPNGRALTFAAKLLCAAFAALALLVIFDGSRIYSVLNAWGTENILAPVCSIERLSKNSMPILSYLILTEIGRFIGLMAMSATIFFVSCKRLGYSVTVILAAIIFVIPPILSAAGFGFMDYFALSPLLIGNVC